MFLHFIEKLSLDWVMAFPFPEAGMLLKSLCLGSEEQPDAITGRIKQSRIAKKN